MTIVACKTAEQIKKQSRICTNAKKPEMSCKRRPNMTFADLKKAFIDWGYDLDDDDDKQLKHIEEQKKRISWCMMLLNDGTVTPSYTNIQTGHTARANTTPEVIQARKEAGYAKRSASMIACGYGQQHHLEKLTLKALMDVTGLHDKLGHQWAPDGVQVDEALKLLSTAEDEHCLTQLKACYTTDGGRFNFNLTKSDMRTKYAGQLIIAIGYKLCDDGEIIVTQVFVLSHPDDMPGEYFSPRVDPKGEDSHQLLRTRMDNDELQKECGQTILDGMLKVTHRTLHDAFFSLDVNRNVAANSKTELIGIKYIMGALPQNTTMTLASDKNKTVDLLLHRGVSLGISAKTATLNNKKQPDGSFSGYYFGKGAAPDHDKCDWVLIVYLDTARTAVEGFSAISGCAVYEDDEGKTFCWNKSERKEGVDYKIKKYPASALARVVDLMFENRGQQITLYMEYVVIYFYSALC
ncbi:hypothetical protein JKP88DRAFT_251607 [Tribonema minus]|uniref:Uncharacterized protein n=1 Tax=Tribonema minus TaxID=303371 RepID=A0A836CMX6_9STRA|nr:hypothetical protein JKP88DRAFT_251607 [Tribonema minus]